MVTVVVIAAAWAVLALLAVALCTAAASGDRALERPAPPVVDAIPTWVATLVAEPLAPVVVRLAPQHEPLPR